jgi:hypothetical protein
MGLWPSMPKKTSRLATPLYETVALSFVIPSSRLAEASRERNDKACALCNIEG